MRICELKHKEVINICDCCRLGVITDVEFDPCSGCIKAFIVPGPGHLFSLFGRDSEFVIPFSCVTQVGDDIVLVNINAEERLRKCCE